MQLQCQLNRNVGQVSISDSRRRMGTIFHDSFRRVHSQPHSPPRMPWESGADDICSRRRAQANSRRCYRSRKAVFASVVSSATIRLQPHAPLKGMTRSAIRRLERHSFEHKDRVGTPTLLPGAGVASAIRRLDRSRRGVVNDHTAPTPRPLSKNIALRSRPSVFA